MKQKGFSFLIRKLLNFSTKNRVASKWDSFQTESDFWVIPEVKADWNFKISGDSNVTYEEYVSQKYLNKNAELKLLSVGCGEGLHERNFINHFPFSKVVGIDISSKSIANAISHAEKENIKIDYFSGDFTKMNFENQKFDVVLFDSSLHHFNDITSFLKNNIEPLLSDDGIVVVFEYCGPNRLQWRTSQLKKVKEILSHLPKKYRKLINTNWIKQKSYRPGILRMYLVDPSEAPDSENLQNALHQNFEIVEEIRLGWNIIQPLFKNIAHHFVNDTPETKKWIQFILEEEAFFVKETNESDAVFGIYKKRN
ncbi:class I SAM-dependent methyltransferase [Flavobacterium sp.]|uniref:class I SAM-dependent methyltransferase n=1 Tax=Flavobacterium sp. TaxID=239 RepID=UPI004047077A